ncbi:MAG: protein kinase [Myxococcales bacterium]|nr:protein kinase [Myxococcales bacterium]
MSQGPTPRDGEGVDADPTKPLSAAELSTGRAAIGRYKIEGVLGRGGMGVVVAAHDPELDRRVAVKILVDHGKAPEVLGAALRREAQALARVSHANVLSVFDAGVDGSPYLVMQLVEGETLGAHLARLRPAPPIVIGLFLQAARGLAAIHAAGLIHRDFKPSNALVDKAGVVWVADLGLARIGELALTAQTASVPIGTATTQTNTIAGTPAYMAPEQFERKDLTPACDQFSFCVALWEAVFGERPFREVDARSVDPIPPKDVLSKRQVQALRRGLSVDPAARFPSMDALITALSSPSRTPWFVGGGLVVAGGAAVIGLLVARGGTTDAGDATDKTKIVPSAPTAPAALVLSDARRITLTDACDEYPSVGPDGTIYYDGIVGPDSHLMAIDPATRRSRELTTTKGWDLAPQPSPDGKQLAFLRKTAEPMAVHVAALDDLAHPRRIAAGGFRPAWSPDGKYVWAGGRSGLTRYDARTGGADRKLELPKGAFPMLGIELPDGRFVLLTKTGSATADGLAIYDAGKTTSRWLIPGSDDSPMDEVLTRAPHGDGVLIARYTVTANIEIWYVPSMARRRRW